MQKIVLIVKNANEDDKKHNSMELELTMTFFALAFAIIIFFDRQKNSCQDNIKKHLSHFH